MGRKRIRRRSSDESADSDSDLEAIVVDRTEKYGLRPRKDQFFPRDLIDDDENQYQSDFEDELESDTLITTTRCQATHEMPSQFYKIKEEEGTDCESVTAPGDENLLDFESFIDKTEIQVRKRKASDPDPSPSYDKLKRRGRKPKWMLASEHGQNEYSNEFHHFLDTKESKVEDLVDFSSLLNPAVQDECADVKNIASDVQENPAETGIVTDIKPDISKISENLAESCEQNLIESEKLLGAIKEEVLENDEAVTSIKNSPASETDYGDANDWYEEEGIESVIEPSFVSEGDKVIHSWSGIALSMPDKSYFVESDNEVAVLKEPLPKGRWHYLIIPRENLKNLSEATSKHIPTIEHMYSAARRIISYPEHKNFNFLIGFDAMPTMIIYKEKFLWLHLHVISDEANFENMLLKKHWNSIHTSFFIHPESMFCIWKKLF